ncbi:MAG: hypothetical protein OEU36_02285 [Gammaproteobacteria bacterium]|nr:hypothetical protein [Gammaproteobacteria bacterium]
MSLIVKPKPSLRLGLLLLVVQLGVIPVVVQLPIPSIFIWCGAVVVIMSFWQVFGTHVLRWNRRAIVELERNVDKSWTLTSRSGERYVAQLLPNIFVHPQMLILRFSSGTSDTHTVLLCRDSLTEDNFRILRVVLGLSLREQYSAGS